MRQTSSKFKFVAIKALCNSINEEVANAYGMHIEENSIIEIFDNRIEVSEPPEEIRSLCRTFSVENAPPTGIKSVIRDSNGERIRFIAFTQMFKKEAPFLTEYVTRLASRFVVEPDQGKYVKIKPTLQSNLPKCLATYFIGGEETNLIDLTTRKILKRKFAHGGGAWTGEKGELLVSLNIEVDIFPEQVFHEIIHVKWPEEIHQETIHHEIVDEMANEITRQLNYPLKTPISEDPSLKAERSEILKMFENFDKALGKIIFSEQKEVIPKFKAVKIKW